MKYLPSVFEIHAYCLIPNHFHLLVKSKDVRPFGSMGPKGSYSKYSRQMSKLLVAYAKYFNYKYKRKGSLFINPFKRRQLIDDHDYSKILLYVHSNPVHHGLVPSINNWSYSSYNDTLTDSPTFLMRDYIINWFNGKSQFIQFHDQHIGRKKNGIYIE